MIKRKQEFQEKNFLEKLTKNRKKFLVNEQKSDIKGLNFKPGKIISAGYKTPQYNIPFYKKFKPKKKALNAEDFVKTSFFMDIHRWRSQSEINEELDILNKDISSSKTLKQK